MTQGYHPTGVQFEVVSENQYGKIITIEGDGGTYGIQPGQRWIPHVIEDTTHPAKIGDLVTLTDYLANELGISAAFVSGVRTIKTEKKSFGTRQVELLGLPCRWFAIGHFEEYQGKAIFHHIWGDLNRWNRKPVTVVDSSGSFHTGKEVRPIILPNH